MEHINWYPGHMKKTRELIAENLKMVDIVIEVIDARIPVSSRNPIIDELVKNKRRLIAFAFGTAAGVVCGKIMCKLTHGKVNPLIGSAGVSAVPMAARVSQKVGAEADPTNFLLMHAMGPNVAGVIGTAVAAGTFLAMFGVS